MPSIEHEQFRDQHGLTRYPFNDSSTLISQTGLLVDPEAFLDARLYPQFSTDGNLFISELVVSSNSITVWVGNEDNERLISADFSPLSSTGILRFFDTYGRPAGILVGTPDSVASFQAWPVGSHPFDANACAFAVSTVVPMPEIGVQAFVDADGGLVSDEVWLVGENGVVLRDDGGNIRVDIVGDPLFVRRGCDAAGTYTTPRFLSTINGVPGDNGSWNFIVGTDLAPDTILRIYPKGDRLAFELVGQTPNGTDIQ